MVNVKWQPQLDYTPNCSMDVNPPPLPSSSNGPSSVWGKHFLGFAALVVGNSGARGVAGVALDPPDIGLATPGASPKCPSLSLAIGC